MKPLLLLAFTLFTLAVSAQWSLIYTNDKDGQTVGGDKEALITAVRSGAEIRVGWTETLGRRTDEFFEHYATPTTVFIASNGEVYAELPAVAEVDIGRRNSVVIWDDDRRIPVVCTSGSLELQAEGSADMIRRFSDKSAVKWFVRK